MKISVSVPDSLWWEVTDEEGSPSEVVQTALLALARQRNPYRDRKWQGDPELRKSHLATLERSVQRLREESKQQRELGYASGAALAGEVDGVLEWLRWFVFTPDPFGELGELVSDPELDVNQEPKDPEKHPAAAALIYQSVLQSAARDVGSPSELATNEPLGWAIPTEYLEGVVEALFDVWRLLEGDQAAGAPVEEQPSLLEVSAPIKPPDARPIRSTKSKGD